ncbi:uncharacterized protein LOC123523682 [Mercenaria mercenaria]|uniref:uncharacterized protein LOC123523682 n=1 Tax=Mercenaria mercenaria TaxID=6596 RepID=UPI001E1D8918|nr:uncharacterized protein LOC123523682 [Mercenaria mercenaria]
MAKSSVYFKIALILTLVAVILHAVGFSTPNWIILSYEGAIGHRTGLWQSCMDLLGVAVCEESAFKGQGWFIVVQVLGTLGLACIVISLLISIALLLSVDSSGLVKANRGISSIGGSFIGIGITIFVIKALSDLSGLAVHIGYSYWLSFASMIDLCIVSVLLLCDKRQRGVQ